MNWRRGRDDAPRPPDAATREAAPRGRKLLRDVSLLALLFIIAFGVAYVALMPGPVISSSHAVPRVLEMPVEAAERELTTAGFRPRRGEGRLHPLLPDGSVIWQDPPAGMVLSSGTVVTLTVSDGLALYPVPDVLQFPAPLARRVVEAAGLRIERVDSVPSAAPGGTVLETRPGAGSARPLGSGVVLVVSATSRVERMP